MEDFLKKEIEITNRQHKSIYKNLDTEKEIFINTIREDFGDKIISDLQSKKELRKKKPGFWDKLINIFR